MGMMDRLRELTRPDPTYRDPARYAPVTFPPFGPAIDNWRPAVNFDGGTYPIGFHQTLQGDRESPPGDFREAVQALYYANPVVFSCVDNRVKLFSEARFQYRRFRNGRPGDLFGDTSLALLESPWPGGTTGDLLAKMLQSADLEGNAFVVRWQGRLAVPRPDWMTIVVDGDIKDLGAPVLGYIYWPGGEFGGGGRPIPLLVSEVAHFAPIPDPLTPHRGMPWLLPVVREVLADKAMTSHKEAFLRNGATVNLVIEFTPGKETFEQLVDKFNRGHEGAARAYKTLFTTPGMKVTPVGQDMREIDFKLVQGAGETRIAAAAGVPPVIVGLSEGLAAATYSNYGQARRRFADQTMRPLWRNAAGSLAQIIDVPAGAQLWYDDRDISALKEDLKDVADIQQVNAEAIVKLSSGGFLRTSAVKAVTANDLTLLEEDPDWVSVQVQPSGTTPVPTVTKPNQPLLGAGSNGKEAPNAVPPQ